MIFNSNYISNFYDKTNYIRNLTFLHKNIWVVIQLFEKSYILLNSLMSNFLVSKIFKLLSYRIFQGKADIAIKKVKYLCLHHVDWSKSKFFRVENNFFDGYFSSYRKRIIKKVSVLCVYIFINKLLHFSLTTAKV